MIEIYISFSILALIVIIILIVNIVYEVYYSNLPNVKWNKLKDNDIISPIELSVIESKYRGRADEINTKPGGYIVWNKSPYIEIKLIDTTKIVTKPYKHCPCLEYSLKIKFINNKDQINELNELSHSFSLVSNINNIITITSDSSMINQYILYKITLFMFKKYKLEKKYKDELLNKYIENIYNKNFQKIYKSKIIFNYENKLNKLL